MAFREIVRLRGLLQDTGTKLHIHGRFALEHLEELKTDTELRALVRTLFLDESIRLYFVVQGLSKHLRESSWSDDLFQESAASIWPIRPR